MINSVKKQNLYFLIAVVILAFSTSSTKAFSLNINPVSFIQKTTSVIVNRVSDIVYYLIMQKKYIFDDFQDPNNYKTLNISKNVDQVLASSTTSTISKISINNPTLVVNPKKPIIITNDTIPSPVSINQSDSIFESVQTANINNYHNNSQILLATNVERQKVTLEPLLSNQILDQVAARRADDLFTNQYFEHDSPNGHSAPDLAKDFDYEYLLIGENLALGNFDNEQDIVSSWMESPGHRENILNAKYKELGVAVKEGIFDGENVTIAVQIFANPLSDCVKPSLQTKEIIDESTVSIKQMQTEASAMFNNLEKIKNNYSLDRAYYNQKIQEYNYFAKKINDAVLILKGLVDLYNIEVNKYNICIKN